ncbi:P-loop containing nucleoside triphosphate hydrolase protein, partial [Hortaea werneckii]
MASRPSVADLTGDNAVAVLARKHWLTKSPSKVLPDVVKELYDAVENDAQSPFVLLLLEQLQAFERYLWPGYSDEASNQHTLLLVLLANTKRAEHLPVWTLFEGNTEVFSSFFRRVTGLSIDSSLPVKLRSHVLSFLVAAFQSLDSGLIRKECAPLVSIGIWQNLHSDQAREVQLAKAPQIQKAWRANNKKFDNADAASQARLRFERSWLYTLVLDFLDKLYDADASVDQKAENLVYCERFMEFLCDLLSQLPTRRYVNTL